MLGCMSVERERGGGVFHHPMIVKSMPLSSSQNVMKNPTEAKNLPRKFGGRGGNEGATFAVNPCDTAGNPRSSAARVKSLLSGRPRSKPNPHPLTPLQERLLGPAPSPGFWEYPPPAASSPRNCCSSAGMGWTQHLRTPHEGLEGADVSGIRAGFAIIPVALVQASLPSCTPSLS